MYNISHLARPKEGLARDLNTRIEIQTLWTLMLVAAFPLSMGFSLGPRPSIHHSTGGPFSVSTAFGIYQQEDVFALISYVAEDLRAESDYQKDKNSWAVGLEVLAEWLRAASKQSNSGCSKFVALSIGGLVRFYEWNPAKDEPVLMIRDCPLNIDHESERIMQVLGFCRDENPQKKGFNDTGRAGPCNELKTSLRENIKAVLGQNAAQIHFDG